MLLVYHGYVRRPVQTRKLLFGKTPHFLQSHGVSHYQHSVILE